MADEKTQLADDKEIAEGLNFNELKTLARELNGIIDQYNADVEDEKKIQKVRIVGAKKLAMFQVWRDAVDALFDAEYENTPEASINYYNAIYGEAEEGEGSEEGGGEGEGSEEEKEEKKKPPKKDKKKSAAKKDRGNLGSSSGAKLKDFADLKTRLQKPQSATGHFDKMCLEGGTLEQLLAKFLKFLSDSNIDFKSLKTKSSVKTHIEYRQARGWVYEEEDGKVKLVGFEK
jgi:hypothetical protein